jgi:hypothetical protein
MVDVAVVEVALNEPNVGVDVATTKPEIFVERIEFGAVAPKVKVPFVANDDVAVIPKYAAPDENCVDDAFALNCCKPDHMFGCERLSDVILHFALTFFQQNDTGNIGNEK